MLGAGLTGSGGFSPTTSDTGDTFVAGVSSFGCLGSSTSTIGSGGSGGAVLSRASIILLPLLVIKMLTSILSDTTASTKGSFPGPSTMELGDGILPRLGFTGGLVCWKSPWRSAHGAGLNSLGGRGVTLPATGSTLLAGWRVSTCVIVGCCCDGGGGCAVAPASSPSD